MRPLSITVCRRRVRFEARRAGGLMGEFAAAGFRAAEARDGPLDLAADDVVLMMGNANWYPVARRQLAAAAPSQRPWLVVVHTEPLPPPRGAGLPWPRLHLREVATILRRGSHATDVYSNYFRLRRLAQQGLPDLLVVTSLGHQEFLAERGISAAWVPLGTPRGMASNLGLPRDIDALFLGELEIPRRRRLVERLRRSGVDVLAVGGWTSRTYVGGEERRRLLNRTKILLNLQRNPGELPALRLLLGMANRALVISEPIYKPAPFVAGRHFIAATIDDMPRAIGYYLAHDDEREHIVANAHRLVTQELTLERSISRLLELITERLGPRLADNPPGASEMA